MAFMLIDLDQNLQDCVKMLEGYISDLRNYLRKPSWDTKCDSVVTSPLLEEEEEDEEEMEDMLHLPVEVQRHFSHNSKLFTCGPKRQHFYMHV